jgi:hypothetical protein
MHWIQCDNGYFQNYSSLVISKYILVQTSTYWHILVYTCTLLKKRQTSFNHVPSSLLRLRVSADCLAWFFLPDTRISLKSGSGYITVQLEGRIMKYPKVLMVCSGTCWYIPAYPGIYWYIPACTMLSDTRLSKKSASGYNTVQGRTRQDNEVPDGMCWYMLVYTSISWYILVHVLCFQTQRISKKSVSGYITVQGRTRQDNELPDSMCWYMLVHTSIYWYILVYTSMYCAFRYKDFFEISTWIQHNTRQDKAGQGNAPKSCDPE